MKNQNDIIANLESSKKFVEADKGGISDEALEEIQSLLSQAIKNAGDDDKESLNSTLDEIDAATQSIPRWNLTSAVRDLTE